MIFYAFHNLRLRPGKEAGLFLQPRVCTLHRATSANTWFKQNKHQESPDTKILNNSYKKLHVDTKIKSNETKACFRCILHHTARKWIGPILQIPVLITSWAALWLSVGMLYKKHKVLAIMRLIEESKEMSSYRTFCVGFHRSEGSSPLCGSSTGGCSIEIHTSPL